MRMGHQVIEQFFGFEELFIIGVREQGFLLAQMLHDQISKENKLKTKVLGLKLEKHQSRQPAIQFDSSLPDLTGIPILLVDDVLNSGRTLAYCMEPLVKYAVPSLLVAVLVERIYRQFPVSASITGIQLSTTLEENVVVHLDGEGEKGVFIQ